MRQCIGSLAHNGPPAHTEFAEMAMVVIIGSFSAHLACLLQTLTSFNSSIARDRKPLELLLHAFPTVFFPQRDLCHVHLCWYFRVCSEVFLPMAG